MKIFQLVMAIFLFTAGFCFAQEKVLMLEDFQGSVSGGPEGTVDFGSGNGSSVLVSAASDVKHSGKQSLKIEYDAVPGGYMYIAKGVELDAKKANWLLKSSDIDWKRYDAFSFYVFGSDSKTKIAFDIKDNGNELWRYMFEDNFKGWKQITCPFNEFFVRADWQPSSADKNAVLDFPVKSFQIEPRPQSKGILYLADVGLIKK